MLKKMLSFGPFFIEEEESVASENNSENPSVAIPKKENSSSAVITTLATIILLLIVVLVGGAYAYYLQVTTTKPTLSAVITPSPIQLPVIDEVGKHIILPNGENPTIATVADVTKLSSQPFFAHAQNGDKVLLYPKSAVAYLYRPSIDKLITMGPLTITQSKPITSSKTPTIPGNMAVLGAATAAAGMKFEK
jgi:hypothetical protein